MLEADDNSVDCTIITGIGQLYAPQPIVPPLDVVIAGSIIIGMLPDTSALATLPGVAVLDVAGATVCPGFVDNHVHVTGGGGELGPESRCPEAQLSQLFSAGITTLVGILGTDSVSRSQESLIAKVSALTRDGLTAYHWAGGYRVPVCTLTGDVQKDLLVLSSCIGVGEVAVGDHRSSLPRADELARIAMDARVGGMISGKAGLVCVHMGAASDKMEVVNAVVNAGVPVQQLLLTHMERPRSTPEGTCWGRDAVQWLTRGGHCDFTAGDDAVQALVYIHEHYAKGLERCSVSSDSFGSYPTYDAQGHLLHYKMTLPTNLLHLVHTLHNTHQWPLERILPMLTSNPAHTLSIDTLKCGHPVGTLKKGACANLLVLDTTGALQLVIAQGRVVHTPTWTQGGMLEHGPHIRRFAREVGNKERLKSS